MASRRAALVAKNDDAILNWINSVLKKRNFRVTDMSRAFSDGILLINLCEILKDEKIGRYFASPSNRIQKIENLNKVFAFCVRNGIRTVCCSAEDIVDGNQKLTRGLLLQMFHVFGDKNTEDWRRTFSMAKDFKYDDLVKMMEAEDSAASASSSASSTTPLVGCSSMSSMTSSTNDTRVSISTTPLGASSSTYSTTPIVSLSSTASDATTAVPHPSNRKVTSEDSSAKVTKKIEPSTGVKIDTTKLSTSEPIAISPRRSPTKEEATQVVSNKLEPPTPTILSSSPEILLSLPTAPTRIPTPPTSARSLPPTPVSVLTPISTSPTPELVTSPPSSARSVDSTQADLISAQEHSSNIDHPSSKEVQPAVLQHTSTELLSPRAEGTAVDVSFSKPSEQRLTAVIPPTTTPEPASEPSKLPTTISSIFNDQDQTTDSNHKTNAPAANNSTPTPDSPVATVNSFKTLKRTPSSSSAAQRGPLLGSQRGTIFVGTPPAAPLSPKSIDLASRTLSHSPPLPTTSSAHSPDSAETASKANSPALPATSNTTLALNPLHDESSRLSSLVPSSSSSTSQKSDTSPDMVANLLKQLEQPQQATATIPALPITGLQIRSPSQSPNSSPRKPAPPLPSPRKTSPRTLDTDATNTRPIPASPRRVLTDSDFILPEVPKALPSPRNVSDPPAPLSNRKHSDPPKIPLIKEANVTSSNDADRLTKSESSAAISSRKPSTESVGSPNGRPSRPMRPQRTHKISPQIAAIRIQSKWRAYMFRKRLMKRVKQIRLRAKVVNEILETEKEYVKRLTAITKGYLEPFALNKITKTFLEEEKTCLSCIQEILLFNKLLLEDLTERIAAPQTEDNPIAGSKVIGDIFCRMAPFLKVYANYCNNYERTISNYQEVQRKDSQVQALIKERLEKPETLGMDLGMLMIAPVQRIPRYILLLQDLIKNTWEDHEDYWPLCTAAKQIQEVADKVNESISIADRMNRVLNIQSHVTGLHEPIVKPSRFYVQEGKAYIWNGESQEPIVLFLFNDALLYVEKTPFRGKYSYKGLVSLVDPSTTFKDLPDLEVLHNCFQLLTTGKTLTFKFKTAEEKKKWADSIFSQMNNSIKETPPGKTNELQISATVTGTETRKQGGQEYTVYSINICNRQTGYTRTIYKRYREFHSLHKQLKKKFVGHVFRNRLPGKQVLGNLSKETVESRRIMLENYLQSLLSDQNIDFIKSSPDFAQFLELSEEILIRERALAKTTNGPGVNVGTIRLTNPSKVMLDIGDHHLLSPRSRDK
eukprot:TRINITY_DN5109_c0_g2_i1.p1 TRINITY_DN5109_c0_g2~~TRINITY_DN5109_c0_g2_i1.p1  ORF type:complete len:1273 (+),score=217.68 TRINITY_DN5109_c0_g2_i1:180-3998(+)